MAGWYSLGTVTVTNGSKVVTGAGTDFINNVSARDAFAVTGGNPNEIESIQSATQITLARPWLGATAGGQAYFVIPTVGIYVDLALRALNMLTPFQAVIDGIGQGLVPGGTLAAPGVRFSVDQDTGVYRPAANTLALVAGGVQRLAVTTAGTFVTDVLDLSGTTPVLQFGSPAAAWEIAIPAGANAIAFVERQFGSEKMRIDGAGNLLVGRTAGTYHQIEKLVPEGDSVFHVRSQTTGQMSLEVRGVSTEGYSLTRAALAVGKNSTTSRSINAGGTINASGADYAEYMTKAASCGTIAAGDICGVDVEGNLTRTWAEAISFVVKSTDPSLVGGDVWAAHMEPEPEAPGPEPVAPGEAPMMPEDDVPEALARWREAALAHTALVIAYPSEHAAWASERAAYEAALPAWEAELETARRCVDRIAFCGQVPVNVTGDFAVGDYIIAVANGTGIKAIAVADADITFDQYRRRLGKVWAVRDGRAWIDVQHG